MTPSFFDIFFIIAVNANAVVNSCATPAMSDFEHLSSDEDQTTYGTLEECEGAWEVLSEDSPSHWSEVTDLVVLSEDDDDEEGDGEDEATRTAGEGTPAAEHKKESRAARRRREKQQKKAQKTAAKALVLAQTKQQQQQTVSAGRFEPLFQLGGSTSSVEEVHRRLAHEEVKQRSVSHSKNLRYPGAAHPFPTSHSSRQGKDVSWRGAGSSSGESKKYVELPHPSFLFRF